MSSGNISAATVSPRSLTEDPKDPGTPRVGSGTVNARIWLSYADEHKKVELRKLAGMASIPNRLGARKSLLLTLGLTGFTLLRIVHCAQLNDSVAHRLAQALRVWSAFFDLAILLPCGGGQVAAALEDLHQFKCIELELYDFITRRKSCGTSTSAVLLTGGPACTISVAALRAYARHLLGVFCAFTEKFRRQFTVAGELNGATVLLTGATGMTLAGRMLACWLVCQA